MGSTSSTATRSSSPAAGRSSRASGPSSWLPPCPRAPSWSCAAEPATSGWWPRCARGVTSCRSTSTPRRAPMPRRTPQRRGSPTGWRCAAPRCPRRRAGSSGFLWSSPTRRTSRPPRCRSSPMTRSTPSTVAGTASTSPGPAPRCSRRCSRRVAPRLLQLGGDAQVDEVADHVSPELVVRRRRSVGPTRCLALMERPET